MKTAMSEETARDIGEIKGLLQGVTKMMSAQNESMNKRIDDMHSSNTRRLDDLHRSVTQRLDSQDGRLTRIEETANTALSEVRAVKEAHEAIRKQVAKTGGGAGAGAGGLIAVGFEVIKSLFWPG